MDDQLCVLLEFTNEAGKVAVGYQDWLETKTEETWENIVKSGFELKFRWPDCDVGPVASMKRRLKSCKWKNHVAKVHAVGGWTKMCEFRANLENFGVLNPSKKDRKLLTKRDVDISDRKGGGSSDSTTRKRKQCASVDVDPDCKAAKSNKLLEIFEEQKTNKILCRNTEEESSDIISSKHSREKISVLQAENKMLREDVARLRTMQAVKSDLPTMMKMSQTILENLSIIENLTKTSSLSQPLPKNHTNIEQTRLVDEVIGGLGRDEFEEDVTDLGERQLMVRSPIQSVLNNTKSKQKQLLPKNIPNIERTGIVDEVIVNSGRDQFEEDVTDLGERELMVRSPIQSALNNTKSKQKQLLPKNIPNIERTGIVDEVIVNSGRDKLEINNTDLGERELMVPISLQNVSKIDDTDSRQNQLLPKNDTDIEQTRIPFKVIVDLGRDNIKEEMMDLGGKGVMVPASYIAKCNHSSISKLSCDILAVLFTKEELSTSSITGKVANLHLKKGTPAKAKLDPLRFEAAKELMRKLND